MTTFSPPPAVLTPPAGVIDPDRPVAGPPQPPPERRVALGGLSTDGVASLFGAMAGSFAAVWLVYERILPFSGLLGFVVCWYVAFLGFYAGIARLQGDGREVREKLVTVVVYSAGLLVVAIIIDQIAYLAWRGSGAFAHSNFLTQDMNKAGPLDPLTTGGVLHAVVGSLEQLGLATLFSVPLGVASAIYMSEIGGRMARPVRTVVEAMTALPSIVAGLFVLGAVILTLGVGKNGLAASLALTVMMTPIVTRASEVVLRLIPGTLREASYALGASQWRTVWNVVLPTARSGLMTAVVLGMARGVGETSPVLLTAGFSPQFNANPFSGQQVSLPLFVWNYVRYPQPDAKARAFGAALTLMLIVLVLFVTARLLGGRRPGELSRRQQRRVDRERDIAAAARRGEPVTSPTLLAPTGPHRTGSPRTGSPPPGTPPPGPLLTGSDT